MAENTKIEWTQYTQNFWHGCTKVSAGCKFCYMFRDKERYGKDPTKVMRSKTTFYDPLKWNKNLTGDEPLSERLVFTNSWSDFFIEEADAWRDEAWEIIRDTPNLVYQILTKRPELILDRLPSDWGKGYPNVWLGVSVENNEQILRIWRLLSIEAKMRFISFEPLLEDLTDIKPTDFIGFDWGILGGESGNEKGYYRYRPCDLQWFRNLIAAAHPSFKWFVKQTGTYISKQSSFSDRHGADINEFPEDLKVRQFPKTFVSAGA